MTVSRFWAAITYRPCRILRKDERKLEAGKNFIEKSACKHLQFPNRGGMIRVPFRVIDDLFCEFGGGERVDENQVGQNERLTPTNMRTNVPLSDEQILEKQRKRFRGTYNHSLDGKGRLVIPLAFRQELGERFVIAPEFDFKSIAIYPEMVFMRLCEHYERLNRKKKNAQLMNYMQWFNSMSYTDQECDAQGRVLLPAKLRSMMLGEEKDVDIMGNDDHLRVAATINNMANFELFKDNLNATWAAIDELEDGEDEKE